MLQTFREYFLGELYFSRSLRSSKSKVLVRQKVNTDTYGGRSFSSAAAVLWNDLSHEIKNCDNLMTFKSKIKTFLFTEAFKGLF